MEYVPAPRITEADKSNDTRYEVKLHVFWVDDKMEKYIQFNLSVENVVMA